MTAVPQGARRRGRPSEQRGRANIQSLLKGLAVVDHLAQAREPMGVTDVARGVGIPKATAHRLLATLHAAEAVAYDPASQRYSLGNSIVRYGLRGLQRLELHRVARPYLERLQRETGETAVLAVRQGTTKVFLDQVESKRELKQTMALGQRLHLFHGSGGQAILANLQKAELEAYLGKGPFPRISASTITDPGLLAAELELVRKRGYALARGERVISIAAPIFNHMHLVVGSLVVTGPAFRFSPEVTAEIAAAVRKAAAQASTDLGHTPDSE